MKRSPEPWPVGRFLALADFLSQLIDFRRGLGAATTGTGQYHYLDVGQGFCFRRYSKMDKVVKAVAECHSDTGICFVKNRNDCFITACILCFRAGRG
jgi:hypothetical protein